MRYALYLHHISLRGLNCWSVKAYKTPNSFGEGLLGNLFQVRPIPTGYIKSALVRTRTQACTINPNRATLLVLGRGCLVPKTGKSRVVYQARLPWCASILGLNAAPNPGPWTRLCSGQATNILIYLLACQ